MLRLLTDEDVPGDIVRGLRQRWPTLDLVRVQEVGLQSVPDPDILAWAAQAGRQVVTRDRSTMTAHASHRVGQGLAMPGLFVLPE
jgi:predicted nuclease of predicted toxin-antitoxin system